MPDTRYRMFIDDTGEIDNAATNDATRRFASITGIIFEWSYYHHTFDGSFQAVKQKHFGLTRRGCPPILHRRELIRGHGVFACLEQPDKRAAWDSECYSMYQRASYSVITTSIDKVAFYYHYPNWNEDVYSLLVQNAIERYFYFLRANGGVGDVMAEAVGDKPDKALRVRYAWAYENGTEHISAHKLQRRLTSREIKIKPRSDDISGLQMADLLAKTCFDHCRRVYTGYGPPRGFSARVAKFLETEKYYRRPDGDPDTYGRVWRPKRAKMKNGPGFRGRPSSRLSLQLCVGVTTI